MSVDVNNFEQEIKVLIADVIEENAETLNNDALFVNDLGVDSLKALEVLAALEKKFRISIPEERLVDITNVTNAIKVVREFVALKQAEVENPAC